MLRCCRRELSAQACGRVQEAVRGDRTRDDVASNEAGSVGRAVLLHVGHQDALCQVWV